MRRIAIIGAGQAGLCLGIGLLKAGYRVTLFSENTLEAILNSQPKGLPILFPNALQIERGLGLNFWEEQYLGCNQFCNQTCDPQGNIALTVSSPLEKPWIAVDQRLKFFYWMQDFVDKGGESIVQKMTPNDLDRYAENYDLIVVSTGKGAFSDLFERDAQKSRFDKPQRHIAAVIITGHKGDNSTAKITVLPEIGEIVQFPFYSKSQKPDHMIAFSAHPGGVMDRFSSIQNGEELLLLMKKLIQQLIPWNFEAIEDTQLSDAQAWLRGAITPTVRKPIAYLASGRAIMGMGDTVILQDPVAGQGANNANKMAHLVTRRIIEQGNKPFDEDWMQSVFDQFWGYAQHSYNLSASLLSPPPHLAKIIGAMAQYPEITKDYCRGINHPPSLYPWFFDPQEAQKYLEQKTSQPILALQAA